MKKILIFLLIAASLEIFAQETLFVNLAKDSVVRLDSRTQQFEFVTGEILIRYKDEVAVSNMKSAGIAQTGLASVDLIFRKYKVSQSERLFPKEQKLKSTVMLRGFNGQEFEQPSLHNIYKLKLGEEQRIFEAIEELKQDPNVIYAEPNYILSITDDKPVSPILTEEDVKNGTWLIENKDGRCMTQDASSDPVIQLSSGPGSSSSDRPATGAPNDPLYSQQWYIPAVHANEVWDTITNDSTQVIGILDTGVDWLHPDLQNKIWINPGEIPNNGIDDDGDGYVDDVRGWDWINNDNNPADDNSHGTHVAGIAAAQQNNGIGIAGVSKKARIMALKVFQSSGKGDVGMITQGINYAKSKGATVINMSFGTYARSLTMEAALANAYSSCVLVGAAGNDDINIGPCKTCSPMFPGALSFVLGVQATQLVPYSGSNSCKTGTYLTEFSNYDCDGPVFSIYSDLLDYEVKSPGSNILSTIPNGSYRFYSGTSMSTPIVSGAAALYRSLFPGRSQQLMWSNLIQEASVCLNIHSAIDGNPTPKLWFVNQTIIDTLAGDDRDSRVDAGETIEIWVKIRNTGGQADSVRVGMRFAEFEDTTTAQILTSKAYLGGLSSYATLTNQWTPLKIHINPNVVNYRDIIFQAYSWYKNSPDSVFQNIVLSVENGQQLQGMLSDTLILTPDKFWMVNGSFRITPSGVLILKPGTHLQINTKIVNDGTIIANGTSDSAIYISGTYIRGGKITCNHTVFNLKILTGYYAAIAGSMLNMKNSTFSLYANYGISTPNGIFEDCLFKDCFANWFISAYFDGQGFVKDNFIRCNFENISEWYHGYSTLFDDEWNGPHYTLHTCTFINCFRFNEGRNTIGNDFGKSNQLDKFKDPIYFAGTGYYQNVSQLYWGTSDSVKISKKIWDFFDDASLAEVVFWPYLTTPSDSAHGFVWRILVNNKDAQDQVPDPVGVGPQRFDIYFNKHMDPVFTPEVSFGVRLPYTQTSVADSGHWSNDYKIYTCYKTIQLYTGDGINRLRVAGARDLDGWEIPIEDQRFEFVIQAAGSASADFIAQAGIGKVYLEWNNAGIPDLLGFNIYRFKNITDTTYSAPVMINTSLITDTTYTDFAVMPNEHYWYYYKVVNTDFKESDSSHFASAIPYNAQVGDANGDGNVNVLDITALIAYMLNQNPQPFLFDAADVNNDKTINILDVIGVVNIITGKKKSISTTIVTNPMATHIKLEDDRIILKNDGQIASMQFELAGESLENIKLSEPPKGFELAYGIVKGKLMGIIYTCSNQSLPVGSIPLIRIDGMKSRLEWGKILAGDNEGNRVPVLKDEPTDQPNNLSYLQAYPNPFTQSVTINFRLPEDAKTEIKIFNMHGKLVNVLMNEDLKEGLHWVDWNGKSGNGNFLPAGIYMCTLEETNKKNDNFSKTIKLIFNR